MLTGVILVPPAATQHNSSLLDLVSNGAGSVGTEATSVSVARDDGITPFPELSDRQATATEKQRTEEQTGEHTLEAEEKKMENQPLTREDTAALQSGSALNASATQEIQRMKYMILTKREIKRTKKTVFSDDKVLVGNKVAEGHSNFIMAYNMLTGIRVAVSRCSGIMKPLKEQDFKATKKLTFDITGNELTPSSKYDFKFKDYSPNVFRELRELFGLDPADYLVSLTAKYILSERNSPGKSGSFLYYSRDYRFIIKTIHRSEHKTLRRMLRSYHQHVKNNPNTLVSQFYGLHRVKMPISFNNQRRKVYFIVMNNLFPPNKEIHRTYDLKGSLWKRETVEDPEKKPVLKDINWLNKHEHLSLGPLKKENFLKQLETDVEFLKKANIMDYSLLVGIHDMAIGTVNNKSFSMFCPKDASNREAIRSTAPVPVNELEFLGNINSNETARVRAPSFSERFYFNSYENGFRSTDEDNIATNEIYYLGIIDCLTNYSCVKRIETFIKGFYQNRQEISAVPAVEYGNRFLDFIKKRAFKEKQE